MGARRVQIGAAALTVAAMAMTPSVARGGGKRRLLSTATVAGLFATTASGATRRWGAGRSGLAAAGVTGVTALIEAVGVRTGRPFGRYAYSEVLRPQFAGVPVIVPMAWTAMAIPARETAHVALGNRSTPCSRVVGGAAALTAWDFFLDPQMVGEGYWRWATGGRFRGIPLSNFAGWFITGLVVMAFLETALPLDRAGSEQASSDLVAEYAVMATMETAAFATFLRDGRVAAIGGLGMLPVAAFAIVRLVGQRT